MNRREAIQLGAGGVLASVLPYGCARPKRAGKRAACWSMMSRGAMPATGVHIVYGTVRLIEREETTFLNWAREPFACIIFNLHVEHSPAGLRRARDAFRLLIDLGIRRGGSYYLTYHRWARRDQVLACYPRFPEFLRLKDHHDPAGRFQSDWHRHHERLLA